jgi:hypothetical protein
MDSMLRPRPQPLEEVCLSFDVGSMNCGVCLFDGSTDAQTILYTKKLQLLDEHATVIHDVKPVKRYLDDLTQIVRTLLKERPFWVLIEEQFTQFKTDPEAKQFQMVFTIQMESCISMYYLQQGIEVRTIHSTKRFAFLGYAGWKSDTRWRRKQHVADVVSTLLDASVQGNKFARRKHDLSNWEKLTRTQRHDVADAISQCLSYYYRNLQDVRNCNPSPPVTEADNTPSTSSAHQTPPAAPRHKNKHHKTTKAEVRGKLERTLTQLGIRYNELLRGEQRSAAKLYKVYKREPQNPYLLDFMRALDEHNQQGTKITDEARLEERVTPLLT